MECKSGNNGHIGACFAPFISTFYSISLIQGEKLPFEGLCVKTKGKVSFSLELGFCLRKSSMSIFPALSIPALINFRGFQFS